jgi:hypothetical protein
MRHSVLPYRAMSAPGPARPRRSPPPHVPSPLDPFLRDLLGWIASRDGGLNPTLDVVVIAEEFDWQPSFVEVLFTAARSRGLLQPSPARGGRGKVTWLLSARGAHWLEASVGHPA